MDNPIVVGGLLVALFVVLMLFTFFCETPSQRRLRQMRQKHDNIGDWQHDYEIYKKAAGLAWGTTSARTNGRFPTLQHFDKVEAEIIELSKQCRTEEKRKQVLDQLTFVHSSRDMAQLRGTPYHTKCELKAARNALGLEEGYKPAALETYMADLRRQCDPKRLKAENAPKDVQKTAAKRLADAEAAYAVLTKQNAETCTWDDVFSGKKEMPQNKRRS